MSDAIASVASIPFRMAAPAPRYPNILVFDSGLGGLTVFAEVAKLWPAADLLYAADDAVFPYGRLSEAALVDRVLALMGILIRQHRPDIVVVACHTASTLVLPPLRARWPEIPFVGTVPAIKPAVAASTSRMISVLATPGTVAREYTRELIRSFAGDCGVTLVGARALAGLAEAALRGEACPDSAVAAEIAPAFVAREGRRTDTVVLACTHYPLLQPALDRLAPWPVTWVDPAPAIARRVDSLLADRRDETMTPGRLATALFTSSAAPSAALLLALRARGFGEVATISA